MIAILQSMLRKRYRSGFIRGTSLKNVDIVKKVDILLRQLS